MRERVRPAEAPLPHDAYALPDEVLKPLQEEAKKLGFWHVESPAEWGGAGLNLLGPFGRDVAIVPHWNNHEGGEELDTSHSFMGQERFERLLGLLPSDVDVVGIDEHTALILDFVAGLAIVLGRGGVTWQRDGSTTRLDVGASMPLAALGLTRQPASMEDIPQAVWDAASRTDLSFSAEEEPPEPVRALVTARTQARSDGDWASSDQLRLEIAAAGWQVRDTPEGPLVVRA